MKPIPVALLLLIFLYILLGMVSFAAALSLVLRGSQRVSDWVDLFACIPLFLFAYLLYSRSGGIRLVLLVFAGVLIVIAVAFGILIPLYVPSESQIQVFGWWLPRRLLLIGAGAGIIAVAIIHFVVLLRRDVADYLRGDDRPEGSP